MLQGTHNHPHKNPKSKLDHLMYFVAFLSPLLTFPQFYRIWTTKDVAGVSLLTWAAYSTTSFLWLLYWREHKEKWIIICQSCILALDIGIVIGVILFSK